MISLSIAQSDFERELSPAFIPGKTVLNVFYLWIIFPCGLEMALWPFLDCIYLILTSGKDKAIFFSIMSLDLKEGALVFHLTKATWSGLKE